MECMYESRSGDPIYGVAAAESDAQQVLTLILRH